MKVTKLELAGRKMNFQQQTVALSVQVTYEGGAVCLALPVSSDPRGDMEERREARAQLTSFAEALIKAAGFLL